MRNTVGRRWVCAPYNGLRWNWTFYENEQTPDFIRDRVAQGIFTKLSLQEDLAESTSD